MALIMVLNDGTTWTNLDGCMIVQIPDDSNYEVSEHDLRDLSEGKPFLMSEDSPQRMFVFVKPHEVNIHDVTSHLTLGITEV